MSDAKAIEVEEARRWAGRQLRFEHTLDRLRREPDPTATPPRTVKRQRHRG